MSIAQMYKSGKISDAKIDAWLEDAICNWDGGDGSIQMHEYIGLTLEQYQAWSNDPLSIRSIKDKQPTA